MPFKSDFRRKRGNDDDDEHHRKLFVGGLSYETTKEDLDSYFGEYGEIVDSVVMLYPDSKRSRGFGFVTFDSTTSVDAVQDARPHKIQGREVETKRATPREITSKDSQLTVKKIFIGGVPEDATEEDIRAGCEEYGNVTFVEIMKNHDTGKPRGFCFVSYDDYDCVDKLCMKGWVEIRGKQVDVKKATPKFGDRTPAGGRGGKFVGGFGGRGGRREDRFSRSDRFDDGERYRGRSRSPVYDRYNSRSGTGFGTSSASSMSFGGGGGGQADILSNLSNIAPALGALGTLVGLLNNQATATQQPSAPASNAPNPLNQLMSALTGSSGGAGAGGAAMNSQYGGDQSSGGAMRGGSYPDRPSQQYSTGGYGGGSSGFGTGYSSAYSTGFGGGSR